MDPVQDPFTRRMIQRAASVQKNRRKTSILQAIADDKPVKIAGVGDCHTDSGTTPNGENNGFAIDIQRGRRNSFSENDNSVSRRSSPSHRRSSSTGQSRSAHLTSESKSSAVCENAEDLKKIKIKRGRERMKKEDRMEKYCKNKAEIKINEDRFINEVMALCGDAKKPADNEDRDTEEAASNVETKLKKSLNDNYDESKNSLDLTKNFNDTSRNLTAGNSTKDSSSYTKGFELGNVRWRGPLASFRSQKKYSQDFLDMETETEKWIELPTSPCEPQEPVLVKAKHKQIPAPQKMRVGVKTIGNYSNTQSVLDGGVKSPAMIDSANKRPNKISLGINGVEVHSRKETNGIFKTVTETLNSPATPLTAEIRQLDADIKRLAFHPGLYTPDNGVELSPPTQVYPNLSKIQFTPTGYSPKKLYQSPCSPEDHSESSSPRNPAVTSDKDGWNLEKTSTLESDYAPKRIGNTKQIATNVVTRPVINSNDVAAEIESGKAAKSGRFKPNMESTRTSSLTDLSKNAVSPCPRESTVSSVTTPPSTTYGIGSGETFSTPDDKNLTSDSTVPYNVDNFLADALGDELYNTTMTYPASESQEKSISQFGVSELISEASTPIHKKKKWFSKKSPLSESSPQHTSTFNRTMTLYRSFTKTIKNKLRLGVGSSQKAVTNDSPVTKDSASEDEKIQALLQEAKLQHHYMYEANKALIYCRSMKEFASSTEQIESERFLLVAGLRRAAILAEIEKLSSDLNNNENEQFDERGEVTIKDFSLPLKEDILRYEAQTGDFVQTFVIAVFHGATVWATRAVSCPIQSPCRIIFDGGFSIPNLSPDFKITVKIYSLKMRRTTFNYDDKYHLNQAERHSRCPSPKKLLRKSDRSLSPKEVEQLDFSTIKKSSFVLSGMVELYLHDLSLASPWPLTSLLPGSVLSGTIDLSLSCKLHLSVSHAGFLTHADEAGGFAAWNRRWFVLQGHTLKFWNYPDDQEDKDPLAVIDLTNCISDKIDVVDRSLCAKPRTLLIETARQKSKSDRNSMLVECYLSCTIVRNLLCCDTMLDFNLWKSKLNHVVTALRGWNVTNRFPEIMPITPAADAPVSEL